MIAGTCVWCVAALLWLGSIPRLPDDPPEFVLARLEISSGDRGVPMSFPLFLANGAEHNVSVTVTGIYRVSRDIPRHVMLALLRPCPYARAGVVRRIRSGAHFWEMSGCAIWTPGPQLYFYVSRLHIEDGRWPSANLVLCRAFDREWREVETTVGGMTFPSIAPFGRGYPLENGLLDGFVRDPRLTLHQGEPVVTIDVLRGRFAFVVWMPWQNWSLGLRHSPGMLQWERNWILLSMGKQDMVFVRSFDPMVMINCTLAGYCDNVTETDVGALHGGTNWAEVPARGANLPGTVLASWPRTQLRKCGCWDRFYRASLALATWSAAGLQIIAYGGSFDFGMEDVVVPRPADAAGRSVVIPLSIASWAGDEMDVLMTIGDAVVEVVRVTGLAAAIGAILNAPAPPTRSEASLHARVYESVERDCNASVGSVSCAAIGPLR